MHTFEAQGLSKSFFGYPALTDVDLTIEAGEVHGLVGENGAGKSTLMKILAGAQHADSGTMRIDGEQVSFSAPVDAYAAGISTVYQELNLLPDRTVAENIFLGTEPQRFGFVDVSGMERQAAELLADIGVEGISPAALVGTLSVAQQQIVEIAKALSYEPRIISMDEQAKVLQESGIVSEMETRDAQDSDDTQVADIDYFVKEGNCDGFIISPYSPDATTAAVERACETGKPVIVFDRKVNSDCPTTFIHSVGGMAWGMDSAGFIADRLSDGGRVVALRTAPGVDVFESRWAAAQKIFDDAGIEYTDYLTGAEPAEIKKALTDEIAKGEIDAVWVDLGDQSVPAIEAFEDAGVDVPIITGEDNMSYLRAWDERGIDGFASVYSAFQWRTATLALSELWQGNEIPEDWVVPQVPITSDELEETLSINEGMPDSHSASFGGEDLPSFPGPWQNREM